MRSAPAASRTPGCSSTSAARCRTASATATAWSAAASPSIPTSPWPTSCSRDPLGTREFFAATEDFIFDREVLNFVVDIDGRDPAPPPALFEAAKRSLRCDLPFVDRLAERVTGNRGRCADPALAAWWRGAPSPTALVRFNMEQAVNPESRVYLAETRDALGLQATVLDWRISDLGFHTMRTGTIAFGAYLARQDIGRARIRDWLLAEPVDYPTLDSGDEVAGWHHMGTTRMADGSAPRRRRRRLPGPRHRQPLHRRLQRLRHRRLRQPHLPDRPVRPAPRRPPEGRLPGWN